ncbi:MAG: ABC transporter permease [Bacteroidales bacterium]|nr:ABC transporter permease [Bacteroidales bacterium]
MNNRYFVFVRLFRESYRFALTAITVNKTRTVLSLLGITIGIFSIISVFTVFDSLEIKIKTSINSLGRNVLFVEKWPWSMGGEYPWWKYWQRPEVSIDELEYIKKHSNTVEHACIMSNVNRAVKKGNRSIDRISFFSVSHDYEQVIDFELSEGRYFTPHESNAGRNVVVIGHDIKENLFPGISPIGNKITISGRKLEVIGVFEKEGDVTFGNSHDKVCLVPITFSRSIIDLRNVGTQVMARSKEMISLDEMKDELTGIMRAVRKLKPGADDNFAINETDILTQGFESFFNIISLVGWIIGGFSLLVGGFGIANIMFVSVRERTNQIGIQKSLGAKKYFILLQFLFEAIFLSLIGGACGLALVYIGTLIVTYGFDFELFLTFANIGVAIIVSAIIGVASGFIPAYIASRLDPVEAIRTSF